MQIISLLISLYRFLRVIIILETVGASQLWIDIYYPPLAVPQISVFRNIHELIQSFIEATKTLRD